MKRNLLIIISMLFIIALQAQKPKVTKPAAAKVSAIKSQSYVALEKFKGDTLGYVQHNFIDNKQKYIGKDLNTLLKDEEIPIKSYLSGVTSSHLDLLPDIALNFYTFYQFGKMRNSPRKPVDIIIIWSPPLPMVRNYELNKKNHGVWTEDELKYFGKQIIGDIMTTNW